MYEPILNKNDGIWPNVEMCIDNYKKIPEERKIWLEEFEYWHRLMRESSITIAESYKTKFEKVQDEPIDLFDDTN